jgi:predicted HicB family RNase H-like nuclease
MNYLEYKGYTATMTYDAEDHILVGRVIGIIDIVSFHGETVAEFERHFAEAIDGYLEDCANFGKEPEKPASGRLMLRVPPAVHGAALAAARAAGQSLNQWACHALETAAQAG